MTSDILLGLMFIAAIWALGAYFVWEYGPGLRLRSVRCPILKKRATIVAEQKEVGFPGSYAGLMIADVTECSLLDVVPLSCHKDCIHRAGKHATAGD